MPFNADHLEHGTSRTELVVVVHGYRGFTNRLAAVREVIRELREEADIYAPELPMANKWLCEEKAESIVADLVNTVDALVQERARQGGGYTAITLVGHSFGAVLARKIAIVAFGEQRDDRGDVPAPFEPEFAAFRERRAWAGLIKRIVLLAGMNRGWSVSSAMDWWTSIRWSALQLLGETVFKGRPTAFAIRKGAPFLVQTRLQWLALMDPDRGPKPEIITVQLLGTADDLVSPDDSVDYAVDLFGAPRRATAGEAVPPASYFYVEVGQSDHSNVVDMGKSEQPLGRWGEARRRLVYAIKAGASKLAEDARKERRCKFRIALTDKPDDLAKCGISRHQMADHLPPEPDPDVTDVVFVMHGIRDKGFWTQKIARTVKQRSAGLKTPEGKDRKFESWTESYGYFAMLPFVLRTVRQRKVEWLMDRYAEARARYPRADFHYMGHSNGTYLAAQALSDYSSARFHNVVFAGSVVRCDYDWLGLIKPGENVKPGEQADPPADPTPRVHNVLNYVATRDWVVALFPKGLQRWRRFNLGSAGHDGFDQAGPDGPVYNVKYIAGAHGAGHEEAHWRDIADFIISGKKNEPAFAPFAERPNPVWQWLGRASFVIFPLLVAVVLIVGIFLLWSIFARVPCQWAPWIGHLQACMARPTALQAGGRAFGFFLYLAIVYLAITRF